MKYYYSFIIIINYISLLVFIAFVMYYIIEVRTIVLEIIHIALNIACPSLPNMFPCVSLGILVFYGLVYYSAHFSDMAFDLHII